MYFLHPTSNSKTSRHSNGLLRHLLPIPCFQPDYTNSLIIQSGGSFSPVHPFSSGHIHYAEMERRIALPSMFQLQNTNV
ncbi:hypothetical protein TNCV_4216171 [Trichonephila clavipes]|nr:hypothetical protein TNCV_4216171 [Trichonephila clavipes]